MKIRYKLLLPILLTVLLVFSALSYLNYRTSRKQLSREIEKRAQGMLESTVFELEGEIQKIEGVAKGIGTTLESIEIESENEVSSLIQNFLEHTPEAFGSAVAFRPGSFSSTRELVAPYYFRRDNRFIFKDIGTEDYNYPNWEWFKNPISSGQPIWGEPYFDEGGGDIWMITYSYPFLKDGSVWGVATVDVSMSELTDNIERIKVGKTGGAFLLSENGTFLSIFQKNLIHVSTIFDLAKKHDDEDLKKLGDEMLEGRSGFISVFNPLREKQTWVAYQPIPSTSWSIGIVFPENEMMRDIGILSFHMMLIAIAGALLISILLFLLSGRISAPLTKLASCAKNIASGRMTDKVIETNADDEIGLLANSFKEMQSSLISTMDDLRQEKGMFQVAFTNMSDGFIIMNPKWNVLLANSAAERLLLLPTKKQLIEHLQNHYESSIPWPKIENLHDKEITFKLHRKESEELAALHLECKITPNFDSGYHLIQRIMNIRDVTKEEAEETSKRDFLSLISHKLITPITALQGKLLLLKDGLLGELSEKQQKDVDAMALQTSKLLGLIQGLISFVTLEGHTLDASRELIAIEPLLSDIVKKLETDFNDKDPQITVLISPDVSELLFNRKYLYDVISHITENGIKFNLSQPPKITISCRKEDGRLVFTISDNGVGIPPEFTDKIFDKFFQIEKYFTGNVDGVGLGLAYVKKVVESFDGRIDISSTAGRGSTFKIALPDA